METYLQVFHEWILFSCTCLVNLVQISSTSKVALEGNVPPPWLDATKGDNLNPAWKSNSWNPVCSRAEKSKLNPKRAWALEIERRGESFINNFDANWFGSPILVECGSLAQEKNLEKNFRWRVKQPRRLIINQSYAHFICRYSVFMHLVSVRL
ncbi:hypothetical protein OROHE_007821 [Orobanche hederae]